MCRCRWKWQASVPGSHHAEFGIGSVADVDASEPEPKMRNKNWISRVGNGSNTTARRARQRRGQERSDEPTNQRTNEPTNQPTNQPTEQIRNWTGHATVFLIVPCSGFVVIVSFESCHKGRSRCLLDKCRIEAAWAFLVARLGQGHYESPTTTRIPRPAIASYGPYG